MYVVAGKIFLPIGFAVNNDNVFHTFSRTSTEGCSAPVIFVLEGDRHRKTLILEKDSLRTLSHHSHFDHDLLEKVPL
jgi:hypothetical protein